MVEWIGQLNSNLALLLLCGAVFGAYIVVRFVLKITERALGCLATVLIAVGVLLLIYLGYYWLLPLLGLA